MLSMKDKEKKEVEQNISVDPEVGKPSFFSRIRKRYEKRQEKRLKKFKPEQLSDEETKKLKKKLKRQPKKLPNLPEKARKSEASFSSSSTLCLLPEF